MSTEPDLTPSEREADRNAAEARAVQHEPIDEWFRRIGTTLSNEDYETGIRVIARLTADRDAAERLLAAMSHFASRVEQRNNELVAERDAALVQIAEITSFVSAFKHQYDRRSMTPTTFDRGVGAMAQYVLERLADPPRSSLDGMRRLLHGVWDEGYEAQGEMSFDMDGNPMEVRPNPYRIEKGEQG